ncbi:glycogen debranching protein GlgX [Novosphingobium piscinae]|uniref:Glycogen debranching protein GlgX n=1 Tax=Novosphingobium piscinae TaxID=1507448 RepID=A0A7X1KNX7_9SPHN|nr:glycogen debranching protein GlgX [Novosphingobium piscinae]MBC2668097.1 glycogen debranching protein GlgX [Novosphingobium piscinae]
MTTFRVRAPEAAQLTLCLFDGVTESQLAMERDGPDWVRDVPAAGPGTRYGLRADGPYAPAEGLWFDPAKLLVDPRAVALDQRFRYDPRLGERGVDTAALVPKAVVTGPLPVLPAAPPVFTRGGLVYEINVRAFTMLHPDVPEGLRGTVAALAHPAVLAHLRKLQVGAVELMPIVAWIDERHLPPLGLTNGWGYNPVVPMALDPGLCPGGVAELRETVAALHAAGIGVILDLVFNHTGESDAQGPTLSFRGLDNRGTYAHDAKGALVNDTGCGNTLDCGQPQLRALVLDTLRHFVRHCGIDGFRFDLAPVLARGPGFNRQAPIFTELAADPELADRVLIAEPWDIGPGGYQLGAFPANWLEWNDRYRDDVRRFWRGDPEVTVGLLATRLAGSSDLFGPADPAHGCRSVNFLAAHDGMTLADCVTYAARRNWANGEDNRDGHGGEPLWNNGQDGPSDDPAVQGRRAAAVRAMLGTLFASTGTIMLTAGDEFGRTQQGNNNAYCQDNPLTWLDWQGRDRALEDHVAALAAWRAARLACFTAFPREGAWLGPGGEPMTIAEWESAATSGLTYRSLDPERRYAVKIDRAAGQVELRD